MPDINIAIDGFSSCGKSTLAKALASKLGMRYIDTGAMYRAITLFCMRRNLITPQGGFQEPAIVEALASIEVSFLYNGLTKKNETLLNGENVEREIRSIEVSTHVSQISKIPEVRHFLVSQQQKIGASKGVVMEGRDIGTVVFPDAEIKIFMTADPEVRTMRRYDELKSKGEILSPEAVRKNLEMRDYEDTTRAENPLRQAEDAIILDNSELSPEQQLDFVVRLVHDLKLDAGKPKQDSKLY